jgi:predicted XRE-type DNA-binding protein
MENVSHWTARSVDDFAYRIASDFVAQIETKLENEGIDRVEFAKAVGVTPGRVSQVLNTPTHFNLRSMVSYAQGAGLKVAIIAYEDDDPKNKLGPINAQVFTSCWRKAGRPKDLFELGRTVTRPVYEFEPQSFYRGVKLPSPRPEYRETEELSIPTDFLTSTVVAQQILSKGSHSTTGQDYVK